MKTQFIPTLGLLAVLIAACTPNPSPPPAAQPIVVVPSATLLVDVSSPTPDIATSSGSNLEAATQVQAPTEAPTALAVATSRGPNLEATDPGTVSLASGQLQFVEFFRFT